MTARFATPEEIESWNALLTTNPDKGNVFQTKEFGEMKADYGWEPRFMIIGSVCILALEKAIPFIGRFWYIPKGPGVSDVTELKKLLPSLRKFAISRGIFLVKIEPELIATDETHARLRKIGLRRAANIQPNTHTVILDIAPPIEDVIASFSSKTRYNIRAAQKSDVKIEVVPADDLNCKIFYDLMVETIYGRVTLRDPSYYRSFWQAYDQAGNGVFLFATLDGKVVATDFIMMVGQKANRKDAASSRDKSVRGISALLEVEAIKYLKEKGITEYDLCGTPPSHKAKDPAHPYYGIGVFKTGFNEHVTDFVGTYDLVIAPLLYSLWKRVGERINRVYVRRVRKGFFY